MYRYRVHYVKILPLFTSILTDFLPIAVTQTQPKVFDENSKNDSLKMHGILKRLLFGNY